MFLPVYILCFAYNVLTICLVSSNGDLQHVHVHFSVKKAERLQWQYITSSPLRLIQTSILAVLFLERPSDVVHVASDRMEHPESYALAISPQYGQQAMV